VIYVTVRNVKHLVYQSVIIILLVSLTSIDNSSSSLAQKYSIELYVSPSTVVENQSVAVFGAITPVSVNETIKLRYITPSGRTLERRVSTTDEGLFGDSMVVRELGKWKVVASWMVDENLTVAFEERIFYVKTYRIVTLNASTHEAFLGDRVNITGEINPVRVGKRVTVYYGSGGGTLSNLTVVKTDEHGRFKLECALNETGRIYFRAYIQEDDECFEAWSPVEEILVKMFVTTRLDLEAKPKQVYLGEEVVLQGSINPHIKGAKVILRYIKNGGCWTDLTTLTVGVNGSFKYVWIPEEPGLYAVVAIYEGMDLYTSSQNMTILAVIHGPYELRVKVIDRNGRVLLGAKLILEGVKTVEIMLDMEGQVTVKGLYPGTYRIKAYFKGVEVYDGMVEIYGNVSETVSADVYTLKVYVKDLFNKPVQGVEAKLDMIASYMTPEVTVSNVTDVYGCAYFVQIPKGRYLLSVDGQQVEITVLENTSTTITMQNLNLQLILSVLAIIAVAESAILIWLKTGDRLKRIFRREER